ncbi:MAG TPA: hypothetical protein VEK82_11145 [Stellaceae bacterium]|nr:hypothetical protein [Stellaceae bacterium]
MGALETALIYFGSFLALGIIAKLVIGRWLIRRDLDLSLPRAQMGSPRGRRRLFLLGFWRDEDPD